MPPEQSEKGMNFFMKDKYVKETKILDKSENQKKEELLVSIIKTKKELDQSNKNFNYANDELIDYYLYKIKANQSKLDYLIKKAKTNGISLDRVNEINIRKNKVV